MFAELEAVLPTFIAVMALVTLTPKTRWLSYTVIVLSVLAELVPLEVNMTALLSTLSVFAGLVVSEVLRAQNKTVPFFALGKAK